MSRRSSFSSSYLSGMSTDSADMKEIASGTFDVSVFVPSWDRRSVCVTEATHLRCETCLVLLFGTKDQQGLRDVHDPRVQQFAKQISKDVRLLEVDSLKVEETWRHLLGLVVSTYRRARRPLKVLIDGSSCPRYYLLGLVATTLSTGLASDITVLYAEGRYPDRKAEGKLIEEVAFTDGQWKAVAIPGLEGRYSPGLKRFYLVSIGFEGWKTMRVVSRSDPDRVSILLGNPGTQPDYPERSLKDNHALVHHYCIPSEQIVDAPAGDAIAAWKALTEAGVERIHAENSYFLCSGTKAHSLALGLRAMCLTSAAVLYNLPEAHRVVPIEPTGKYWRFDISSLTVPH
jgi:hypothetical protein